MGQRGDMFASVVYAETSSLLGYMSTSPIFTVVDNSLRLGKHICRGGKPLSKVIEGAYLCKCVQISLGPMQSYNAPKPLSAKEVSAINDHCDRFGKTIYSHLPYVCNFGNPSLQNISVTRLMAELVEMERLDGKVVLHPSAKGTVEEVANCLAGFQGSVSDNTILLENSAGQGNSVMVNLEQIDYLARRLPFVGFCIDTCHAFAAGLCSFRSEKDVHQLMSDLDHVVGRERLCCFHLNDSKKPYGSCVDRHEDIVFGKGHIWGKNHSSLVVLMQYAQERGIDLIREGKETSQDFDLDLIELRRIMRE